MLHCRYYHLGYICSVQVRVRSSRVILLSYDARWTVSAHSLESPDKILTRLPSLVVWYLALSVGLGYFFASRLSISLLFLIGLVALIPIGHTYSDVVIGETRYAIFMFKKWRQGRRSAQDVEENMTSKWRIIRTRRRRVKVPAPKAQDFVEPEKFYTPAPLPTSSENPFADVHIPEPPLSRHSGETSGSSTHHSSHTHGSGSHTAYSEPTADTHSTASIIDIPLLPLSGSSKDAEIAAETKSDIPVINVIQSPGDVLRKDMTFAVPVLTKGKGVDDSSSDSKGSDDEGKLSDTTSDTSEGGLGYFLSRPQSRGSVASSQVNSPLVTPLTELPPRAGSSSKGAMKGFSSKLPLRRHRAKEVQKSPLTVSS